MTDSDFEAKRQWERYKIDIRVRITYSGDGAKQVAFGRGYDVSGGGMAIFTPVNIMMGAHIEVQFSIPGMPEPVEVEAVVRNRQGYRYGVEFAALTVAQRKEIIRMCEIGTLTHPA
jgi:c-di-GMP-binding flagellar brake protein YcgR